MLFDSTFRPSHSDFLSTWVPPAVRLLAGTPTMDLWLSLMRLLPSAVMPDPTRQSWWNTPTVASKPRESFSHLELHRVESCENLEYQALPIARIHLWLKWEIENTLECSTSESFWPRNLCKTVDLWTCKTAHIQSSFPTIRSQSLNATSERSEYSDHRASANCQHLVPMTVPCFEEHWYLPE